MSLNIPRPRSLKARIATVAAASAIVAGGIVAIADPASATASRTCYAPDMNIKTLGMRPHTTSSVQWANHIWNGGYKVTNTTGGWINVTIRKSDHGNLYCNGTGVYIREAWL